MSGNKPDLLSEASKLSKGLSDFRSPLVACGKVREDSELGRKMSQTFNRSIELIEKDLQISSAEHETEFTNERGLNAVKKIVLSGLVKRLEVTDFIKKNPEVLDVKIPHICFVGGMVRSGTTLLHNLLVNSIPNARAFEKWELTRPLPLVTTETRRNDPRIAEMQKGIDAYVKVSKVPLYHLVNANEPEESTFGFIDAVGFGGTGPLIVSLKQFANECVYEHGEDYFEVAFFNFRVVIQLLLWKCPMPSLDSVLVLKCPFSSTHQNQFKRAFPEAAVVNIFRHLLSVYPSAFNLLRELRSDIPGLKKHDEESSFKFLLYQFKHTMPGYFLDQTRNENLEVQYVDFMENPEETILRIVEWLFNKKKTTIKQYKPHEYAVRNSVRNFLANQKRLPPVPVYETLLDRLTSSEEEKIKILGCKEFVETFAVKKEKVRKTVPSIVNGNKL